MQFFFAPVWGRMSDRIGRRPVLLISLTASCIGYFLFGFARHLWVLFASRIIAGAGGANIGTAQAYIADTTTNEERAKGMRRIGLIMLTLFLTLLSVAGMETSVTLHARDRFHFQQIDLAYFFVFMGVMVVIIQGGLIGKLARAFGERTLVTIGTASYTVGLVL